MINKQQGFTLIELMVVVLLIGILVSIGIPVFMYSVEKAKTRSCQNNLRVLDAAIQTYRAESLTNPTSINDLAPRYVKRIPKCPIDPTDSDHDYELIGDDSDPPVQASVKCGDENGDNNRRDGIEDDDHFDD